MALIVQTLFHDDGRCHSSMTARIVQEKGVPRVMSKLTVPEIKPEAVKSAQFAQFAQTTPPIHLVKPVTPSFKLHSYSLQFSNRSVIYYLDSLFLGRFGKSNELKRWQ